MIWVFIYVLGHIGLGLWKGFHRSLLRGSPTHNWRGVVSFIRVFVGRLIEQRIIRFYISWLFFRLRFWSRGDFPAPPALLWDSWGL